MGNLPKRLARYLRRDRRPAGARPPAPFVVGAGRSGNTMLRLMLDAHPDLAIPPETDFIVDVAAACAASADPPTALVETVVGHWRFTDIGIDPDAVAQRVGALEPFTVGAGLDAVYTLYAEKHGKRRWGDKSPSYLLHIPLIERVLPEARFVHIIRDGRDVALSIAPLWFGPSSVREAAAWWVKTVEAGRAHGRLAQHYLEVRYEELVLDTEPTLRRICTFLELPWSDAILRFHERAPERVAEVVREFRSDDGELIATVEQRHAIHRLTAEPPAAQRIGRWRTDMSDAERRDFEATAGALLRELGYAA